MAFCPARAAGKTAAARAASAATLLAFHAWNPPPPVGHAFSGASYAAAGANSGFAPGGGM